MDLLTLSRNLSNAFAASFSFPPIPGIHPNANAAACTIIPAWVSHKSTINFTPFRKTFLMSSQTCLKNLKMSPQTLVMKSQIDRKSTRLNSSHQIIRSEEHTSELQSPDHLVCRLLLEKKKSNRAHYTTLIRSCH